MSKTIYTLTLNRVYLRAMTAYDKIDQAFARSCFRQAKKLMRVLVQHYRQTEMPLGTAQELERRIKSAMLCKETMPFFYNPQRILMLRAKRYVLRRRSVVRLPKQN